MLDWNHDGKIDYKDHRKMPNILIKREDIVNLYKQII